MFRFQFEYNFEDLLTLNRVAVKIAKPGQRIAKGLLLAVLFCAGLFIALTGVLLLWLDRDTVRGVLFQVSG